MGLEWGGRKLPATNTQTTMQSMNFFFLGHCRPSPTAEFPNLEYCTGDGYRRGGGHLGLAPDGKTKPASSISRTKVRAWQRALEVPRRGKRISQHILRTYKEKMSQNSNKRTMDNQGANHTSLLLSYPPTALYVRVGA